MSPVDDCQAAINGIWGFRGGVSVVAGCVEVFESGGCVVEVCNMEGEGSSIDYMGIAPAAQSVLAYCREGGDKTAGATKIVGFEQGSQAYSSAEVRLRPPMVGGPPDVPDRRRTIEERKRGSGNLKQIGIRPRNEDRPREYADQVHPTVSPYVEAEFGLYREGEAQFGFTYLILPQTRTLIRDQMLREWNRRRFLGFMTRRTVGIEVIDGDLRYNLEIVATGRQNVSNMPIVDRGGMVDAFLRLHERDGNPRVFTGYAYTLTGEQIGMMTLMINPVMAMPTPERQIMFGGGSRPI
ncbi:hypothetical protein CC79DRAFT_1371628 [Sarocladium strictum]